MPGKKYRHADLRYVHAESEVLPYLEQQSVVGFLRGAVAKLGFLGSIYLSTAAFLLSGANPRGLCLRLLLRLGRVV